MILMYFQVFKKQKTSVTLCTQWGVFHFSTFWGKSKVLKNSGAVNTTPITLDGDALEEMTSFTYLGTIVDKQWVTDADENMRIGRARAAFLQMKNIWASPNLTINIKIRIFNNTVKPVQLYGAETRRTEDVTLKKIKTFINTCLRRILRVWWPETITKRELWKPTKQKTLLMRSSKDAGEELETSPESQWPVPHVKPQHETCRRRESKTAQETPGATI